MRFCGEIRPDGEKKQSGARRGRQGKRTERDWCKMTVSVGTAVLRA